MLPTWRNSVAHAVHKLQVPEYKLWPTCGISLRAWNGCQMASARSQPPLGVRLTVPRCLKQGGGGRHNPELTGQQFQMPDCQSARPSQFECQAMPLPWRTQSFSGWPGAQQQLYMHLRFGNAARGCSAVVLGADSVLHSARARQCRQERHSGLAG